MVAETEYDHRAHRCSPDCFRHMTLGQLSDDLARWGDARDKINESHGDERLQSGNLREAVRRLRLCEDAHGG